MIVAAINIVQGNILLPGKEALLRIPEAANGLCSRKARNVARRQRFLSVVADLRYAIIMRALSIPLVVMIAGCTAPVPAPMAREPAELAGRAAGVPVRCLSAIDHQQLRVSEEDRSVVLYGSGRTIWINRLGPACRFSWSDIPVFEVTGSSYCRGDIVHSIDQASHMSGPSCILGDFVPYTRP